MTWRVEWQALSARIEGLVGAGSFLTSNSEIRHLPTDVFGELINNAKEIYDFLKHIESTHREFLPNNAASALNRFIQAHSFTFQKPDTGWRGVVKPPTLLASVRVELEHLFSDREATARSLTNRAFAHLQRSIVADPAIAQA